MTCSPNTVSQKLKNKIEICPVETEVFGCDGTPYTASLIGKVAIEGITKVQLCNPQEDSQITCVSENTNLYIIDWSNDTNTYSIYDFSGNDVTGTVTPVKCEDIEITAQKDPVCDGGITLWEHSVYKDGVLTNSYYTVPGGVTPIIPGTVPTIGACIIPDTIKKVPKKIDCSGTIEGVETTKTVEAIIDQVVDVKQCNKSESLSEIQICVDGITVNRKTVLESNGTETFVFETTDGVIITEPANYTIGACARIVPDELSNAIMVANGNTFTLPANVISFTVTVQDSGTWDISFDGGTTQLLTGRIGSRTWGNGTIEPITNSDKIIITSNGDVDVIWEL